MVDQVERTKEDLELELKGALLQIDDLQKRLQLSKDNCAAMIDERNVALDKLARISSLLDRAKGLGLASVEGKTLHDFRGDLHRGEKYHDSDS